MPGLVLQPVDQTVARALAQQLSCWARTASGGIDPLVAYRSCCAAPGGAVIGRWEIDPSLCTRYGPLPFTAGGEPIACDPAARAWTPYLIGPGDVTGIDPVTCTEDTAGVAIAWEPDPSVMTAVAFTVTETDQGVRRHTVAIDFGDGTAPTTVLTGQQIGHDYTRPGTYTVTAWPTGHPDRAHQTTVTVKTHAPTVHLYSDPDDDWEALLWVDEAANGTVYAIDWGDGSGPETIQRDPPPYPRVPHQYTAAGSYTATVTDTATKRTTSCTFDCGGMGVLFLFPDNDATPFLIATRMRVGASWELDWGDGTAVQTGTVPANASLRRSHTTALDPGTYTVVVREIVGGAVRRELVRELTIPSVFSLQMHVSMSWRKNDTEDPRHVTVTPVQTPPEVSCTVDWGDGSATETVAGGATVGHTYGPIPAEGYMVAVEEDGGEQRRFHRLVGEPVFIGQPHLSAWARWSAEIVVRGIPGLSNADWYGIDWGDGNNQLMAAVGADWNAWHRYTAPGTYTLVIDGPGMATPVLRSLEIPTYPQPVLDTEEDTTDPARMTTLVHVDNSACGGEVELSLGDGTTVTAADGATVAHQYTEPGMHTVIARCLADLTARGRINVEVPYGDVQTLSADVARKTGADAYTARARVTAYLAGEPLTVSWDDGASENFQPPTEPWHQYDWDGDYTVRVAYVSGLEHVDIPITIPFEGA